MPKKLLKFQNMLFRLMPNSMFKQIGFKKADGINLCNTMSELDFSDSLCTELDNSEFERRKLMYPFISVFIIVVGALLLVFANKIIKNNKVNRIGIKVVGGILIIVGLLLLYFLLSGKLTLPLSK